MAEGRKNYAPILGQEEEVPPFEKTRHGPAEKEGGRQSHWGRRPYALKGGGEVLLYLTEEKRDSDLKSRRSKSFVWTSIL